jgi:hypothetical protein
MKQSSSSWLAIAVASTLLLAPVRSGAQELRACKLPAARLYYVGTPALANEKESSFQLSSGKVLVSAQQPVTAICTDHPDHEISKIEFNAGTIALLSIENGIIRLTNLYEPHHESIKVTVQQHDTLVAVGEEVCIAREMDAIYRSYENEPGSRRLLQCEQPGGGYSMVLMEISLQPPLHNDSIVKSLHKSQLSEERRIYSRLAKMAACLSFPRRR